MGRLGKLLIVALAASILAQWLLALQVGLGRDAGFYLPMARDVLRGAVPIRDFAVFYSPGFIYLFAPLGQGLLMSPVALKLFMMVFHGAASWLIYSVLLERRRPRPEALLHALLYHAWVISLDGKVICLEPLQNVFLIIAWLTLLRRPDRCGAGVAGLAAGAALMMKQYSLLLVPALALLALTGAGKGEGGRERWARVAVFLAGLPGAFVVFVVATRQDVVDAFRAVSTYGGKTDVPIQLSVFARLGPDLTKIFDHSATLLLLPVAAAAVWLVARERSSYHLALALAFASSLVPLLVAQYPHYIQLAVPWAVQILSELARLFAARWVESPLRRQAFRERLLTAAVLVLVPLFAKATLQDVYDATSETESRTAHLAVAQRVADALPEHRDVLVINRPWLYVLADLTPPGRDYRWPTAVGFAACDRLRDRARFVVLMPFRGDHPEAQGHRDTASAREWLRAGNLVLFESLSSPWGAPIELYRPSEGRHPEPEDP